MELLDGGVYAKDEIENSCFAEVTSSEDADIVRSSSYEDIYVGTKLPGDEPADDKGDVVIACDVGDRFDSRPSCIAQRKQSGTRKSSSFENLYEMQDRQVDDRDIAEMESDSLSTSMHQWQTKDASDLDLAEKDSMLAPPVSSRMWQARKSCPIDITVESGLDRVGQSACHVTKRSSCHLLQHSMSYDLEMDKKTQSHRRKTSGGSSPEGDADDGTDFQRGMDTAAGIRNGCRP